MQSVVRQVAYATQGRRDRKERHLAVAAYLQTLPDPGDDFAALVAQHLLDAVNASSTGDADVSALSLRAKELLVRAAERSLSIGSPSDALDLLRSALQLVDDATERCGLLESAATAARDAGRFPESITMAREAVQGWQSLGDPVGAGRAAALDAEATSYLAGDRTQLVDYLRPHWDALVDLPDAESALLPLAAVLARLHAQRDEHEASRSYLERQLRIAEAVGDTDQLATALLRLANILSVTGAPEAGAIQWRAVADYAASHDLSSLHAQLSMLVAIYDLPRDLAKGQREFREALEIAKRSGAMPRINLVKWNLGFSLWTSGDWPELESIIEDLEESDESFNTQFLLTLGGWLDTAKGRMTQRDLPGDVAQGAMEVSIDAWTLTNQMVALAEAGDGAGSTRAAERAVAAAVTSMGLEDDFGRVWPIAVLGALDAGSADVADRLLDPVRNAPRGLVTPYVGAQYRLLKGLVGAALEADPAEVESDFRAGIAALDAYGAVPDRARGQESLGRWLVSQGRASDAEPLIEQARATYAELGAFGWLARVDDVVEPAGRRSGAKAASP
jgi:tetratricopeptide (TPR) repeat protein